jgi:cystathionine beta-lyase
LVPQKVEQMKRYDFDQVIDRKCSGSVKVDGLKKIFGNESLTPMWVADMDFETPDFVVNALKQRLEHPVFGYTMEPDDFRPAIKDWVSTHHGWEIESDWITYIPGIVKGIGMVINALLDKGDKIIIQPPVYHPFRLVSQRNGHEVVYNPMKELPGGGYEMDFENLEQVCDDRCKLLILANPHNPAGIVWSRETLVKLAEFCHRKGLVVVSDEIHCDMALYGNKHIPFASVSPEAAACSITFAAPSKTFNIAGIVCSYAVVPDDDLRRKFYDWLDANEFGSAPIFSYIATIAAFRNGEEWRRQMLEYVERNIEYVMSFCKERIPQIRPLRPQASFLVWLDCRDLNLDHDSLIALFKDKAGLALNDGEMFNPGGEGFMRLNVGTPLSVLETALNNLEKAIKR